MTDLLIRKLDPETLDRLKARARARNRSLQGEIREILEREAGRSTANAWELADRIRGSFENRVFGDSALLVREDRDR